MKLSDNQLTYLYDMDAIEFISNKDLLAKISELKRINSGCYGTCYKDNKMVLKYYYKDFEDKRIVNNLINLIKLNHKDIATPKKILVIDNVLKAYYMPFMDGISLEEIIHNTNDISLYSIKSIWESGYQLADFLSNNKILICDLKSENSSILNNKLKLFDTDFYSKMDNISELKKKNYESINCNFANFIERYLFDYSYECEYNDSVKTNEYLDDCLNNFFASGSNTLKGALVKKSL